MISYIYFHVSTSKSNANGKKNAAGTFNALVELGGIRIETWQLMVSNPVGWGPWLWSCWLQVIRYIVGGFSCEWHGKKHKLSGWEMLRFHEIPWCPVFCVYFAWTLKRTNGLALSTNMWNHQNKGWDISELRNPIKKCLQTWLRLRF